MLFVLAGSTVKRSNRITLPSSVLCAPKPWTTGYQLVQESRTETGCINGCFRTTVLHSKDHIETNERCISTGSSSLWGYFAAKVCLRTEASMQSLRSCPCTCQTRALCGVQRRSSKGAQTFAARHSISQGARGLLICPCVQQLCNS